jgi:hypothetical protein
VGRIVDRALVVSVLKGALASGLMAVALWLGVRHLGDRVIGSRLVEAGFTLILLLAGVALYFLFSLLLGNGDIRSVVDLVVRRFKGKQDRSM